MADFVLNPNSGSAFPNYSKEDNETIESYGGSIKIDEEEFEILLTEQDSKNGNVTFLNVTGKSKAGDDALTGAVFVNTPREGKTLSPNAPQYTGNLEVNKGHPSEIKKRISIWIKQTGEKSKKPGQEYFSMNVQEPYKKQ